MDFKSSKETSQEEERQSLIITNNHNSSSSDYYGAGVATVKVVEYMLSSMSNELLTKFPDNSAFDFDYTQSSIWSPLVPHPSNPSSPAPELQRKLNYEEEEEHGFTASVRDTVFDSGMFNCFGIHHKFSRNRMVAMKRRRSSFRVFDSSNSLNVVVDRVDPSPVRIKLKQGWKVLKAASKRFKKSMKKKDSGSHLRLSQISY